MFFISSDPFLIFHKGIGYFMATIELGVMKQNKLVVNLKCNQTINNEEKVDTFFGVYSVQKNETYFIHIISLIIKKITLWLRLPYGCLIK